MQPSGPEPAEFYVLAMRNDEHCGVGKRPVMPLAGPKAASHRGRRAQRYDGEPTIASTMSVDSVINHSCGNGIVRHVDSFPAGQS